MFHHFLKNCRDRLLVEARVPRRWGGRDGRTDGLRVYYGSGYGRDKLGVISGGIVKLQDLIPYFPDTPTSPDILYLISSALPPFAPRMAAIAKRRGGVIVLNQNGVAYPAWHGPGWEHSNRPLCEVLKLADYVFYQSGFCKMSADRFLESRPRRFEILLNPVDTLCYTPSPAAAPDAHTLLLAGTHTHFYRVSCAIETLALLRERCAETRLIVAGKSSWRHDETRAVAEARALARRLGLEKAVDFVGPYTQAEAPSLLRRAGVLLHTKYNDPCPRLVAEALACGLPVVYSASGGVPELVGDEAGIGVPAPLDWERDHPPDPRALADAVLQVWERHAEYAAAARRRAVSSLDVRPWLERHRVVFESLVSGSPVPGGQRP